jgi:predicted nuclease of predicted toxin-antitoxin system
MLLDANVSFRLCPALATEFGECEHVNEIAALSFPATDAEIWEYAQSHCCVIVTQDADFLYLAETRGFPPKVILLRAGNVNRRELRRVIVQAKTAIADFYRSAEQGVLEII